MKTAGSLVRNLEYPVISYSFYLLHTVALAITLRWLVQPLGPWVPLWTGILLYFAASLLLSVVGAWVSFRVFAEFYFRRGEHVGALRLEGRRG